MLDVALESVRAAVLLVIVGFLWRVGRDRFDQTRKGWSLIISGFGLLLFGSLLDISDNFESLNFLIVIGDTEVEAFLEKFVGFLGGFVVVAMGLVLWVPSVQRLNAEISERKLAEEALKEAHDDLELRIKERTRDIEEKNETLKHEVTERKAAEEAFFFAMKEAEIANQTKSEFLANMSHELRTPLNAIIGFSEIIKDERLGSVGNAKYRDYADDINESGQHLLGLINDILDLSKVESGTDELHEENIEISETANAIMKLVMGLDQKGNVELELDVSGDIPVMRADERKVKQILLNLLSNAIKFTPDGGKITLRIWSRAESGYVFQVIDTGIGIAFEDIPKALAPFQQIDSGLNRKHGGTGLGLSLTKLLVEMHGGYLDLQSKVGAGTTVTVRFPAERIVGSSYDTKSIDTAAKKAS